MNKLKIILSKVLNISIDKINDFSSSDNIETWDSFNNLMLISELEKEFNIKFTIEEVTNIKSVKDIKKILIKYGVYKDD